MERRGSGLHKICEATELQDDYRSEFMPSFESVSGGFRVTLWDMNYSATQQVTNQVSDQVRALLSALGDDELSAVEIMDRLMLAHRPTFRQNYLNPALKAGVVERTIPDKLNSRLQKYRRTAIGVK